MILRFLALILIALSFMPPRGMAEECHPLLQKVIEANGGVEALRSLQSVAYTYIVKDSKGQLDISKEEYLFSGELSRGTYFVMQKPERGPIPQVQVYDGFKTRVYANGQEVSDKAIVRRADFLRKTNFYWFAMMFKLCDPGTIVEVEGKKTRKDIEYTLVSLSFEPGVGDVTDTYLLYINPATNLVDRFLFTVMDFDRVEPLMMEVEYRPDHGILVPWYRRFAEASWEGEIQGEWTEEFMVDLRFNTGLNEDDFSRGLYR